MFNKLDGVLAVVAVGIMIHLLGVYSTDNFMETQYGPEMQQASIEQTEADREEELTEEELEAQEENEAREEARRREREEEEAERKEERDAQRKEENRKAEKEREAAEREELERADEIAKDNQLYADLLHQDLNQMMAGDPYNSGRYLDVSVDTAFDSTKKRHHVEVNVDENTFGSLDLNLKKTVYETISQEIQQFYFSYLDERPDELLIELVDSQGVNLSTYSHDIIGDRYILQMNHNNDNNF